MRFQYLLEIIKGATESNTPFRHIQIDGFFRDEDFAEVVSLPEVALKAQKSDEDLFDELFKQGYEIIDFPGCITDKQAYIQWHKDKSQAKHYNNTSCEGFGMTLRLMDPKSEVMLNLLSFFNSIGFRKTLANKFDIAPETVAFDMGIQKYLDGYEISPHPDVRKKALTFMVNINPGNLSEWMDHHTHYLKFKDSFKYVQTYWEGNQSKDRCWVPWEWCHTEKMQTANNSIVIFSPSNDTIHGIKANYNHLEQQRTQIYGNFWHNQAVEIGDGPAWEDFVVGQRPWPACNP